MASGSSLIPPMHSKSSLSNSNPQLNASSQGDGQGGQVQSWDNDKTKGGIDMAGNRNSMAEPRLGAMNIPGLTTSNKKVNKMGLLFMLLFV